MKFPKCTKCEITDRRRSRVYGKGSSPADILFIAEAPGKSEDLMGVPLVGASGVLLERMINDATNRSGLRGTPSYYVTYLIQCRPYELDKNHEDYFENREPSKSEILNCTENMMQISYFVKPRLVVFIGKLAEKYYEKEFPVNTRILQLSYLLMYGGVASPNYLATVRTLTEAFKTLEEK